MDPCVNIKELLYKIRNSSLGGEVLPKPRRGKCSHIFKSAPLSHSRGILLDKRRCGMSILDRVTKVVGDVVDRGKKEVDQFVRIQRINSQIGDFEKTIRDCNGQIQQIKIKIGEMAIEMLQAGTLSSQEMKALLDQIAGIQQQIASSNAEINQKKAEIERIKAEGKSPAPPSPTVEDSPVPPPPPPPSPAAVEPTAPPPPPTPEPAVPPPPPPAAERRCPQCGKLAGVGTFCSECGTKLP
jgi:hypothetical protein